MQLELIHRHAGSSMTHTERVNDLIHVDNHRVRMISQRAGRKRRKDMEAAGIYTINSGAYKGTGQYFVPFRVGTPSQRFLLVVDTGSDLTWMKCRYQCKSCLTKVKRRRIFHAGMSSSFETIPCSSDMCKTLPFSLAQCSTPMSPCLFDYRYADGSRARGVFANETLAVALSDGRKIKIPDTVIGCSSDLAAWGGFQASDGVLGLGYSNSSFVIKAKDIFGGKFSYCLVDHLSPKNVSSYLTFGHDSLIYRSSPYMQYTDLALNVISGFYAVNVAGISVGGALLDAIPVETWDVTGQGGVIIDSGTSLTYLAGPAYNVVMDALKSTLKPIVTQVELAPFEFCFSTVGFNKTMVPKLIIHFANSAQLEPPVKSYVIDVAIGVKCLGFMPNGWPDVSIIGNIMQQNFFWEFDTINRKLGFSQSDCITN